MPKPTDPSAPLDDEARDAAHAAWERGDLEQGDTVGPASPAPGPDDPDWVPTLPKRAAFPPSVHLVIAGAFAFLALEPSSDLPYEIAGPTQAIDLGRPGDYHFDLAVDGARAKVVGFASQRRGSYAQFPFTWEAVALTGAPMLVRREPQPPAPPSTVEYFTGEGRLVRLDDAPSSFVERLIRSTGRYTSLKATFQTYGELPVGKTTWLLLDGERPRTRAWPIAAPLVLWALALFFVWQSIRSYRLRALRARKR